MQSCQAGIWCWTHGCRLLGPIIQLSFNHQTCLCGLARLHTKPGMKPWLRKPDVSWGKSDPPTVNAASDCWAGEWLCWLQMGMLSLHVLRLCTSTKSQQVRDFQVGMMETGLGLSSLPSKSMHTDQGAGTSLHPRQSQFQSSSWYLRARSQGSKPCLSPPVFNVVTFCLIIQLA